MQKQETELHVVFLWVPFAQSHLYIHKPASLQRCYYFVECVLEDINIYLVTLFFLQDGTTAASYLQSQSWGITLINA